MVEQPPPPGQSPLPEGGSTDDPDEVFDLVDLADRVIGRVRRADAHRDPTLAHRSVQVLVFASDGRLLLQRRSATKDLFPGSFCASASGHVASGEDYLTTARREVAEELGISPQLAFAGKVLVRSAAETEITALYLARSDGPYHFHPTETAGGALFTWAAIQRGRERGSLAVTPALGAALDEVGRLRARGGLPALLCRL